MVQIGTQFKMINLNDPAHPGHSNHLISTKGKRAQRIFPDVPLFESTVEHLLEIWDEEPTEQCGFIDSEQNIWVVPNIHENSMKNFLMNQAHVENVMKEIYLKNKNSILGIFHTHPNSLPWPSPRDIVGWPDKAWNWRYFIVTKNEVLEWELVND